jgi:hypothetical protein
VRLLYRRRLAVRATSHEFFVEWNSLATQGALVGAVSGKVSAYEAEDGSPAQVDRGPPPETAHAHDLCAELFDQLDQQVERAAGGDEVLDEQDLRPGAEQPVKFDRQGDASLTT